jgi:23S rRNA (guanosine2251-2'-O)-methyltransferase
MDGQADYRELDFTLPTAIVIGGEGQGLSELVRKSCDWVASIPMKGKIMSLNASVAAAVIMYEALRQRDSLPRL